MSFENMQFNEKLMRAVQTQRYKTPTEIQKRAIPLIMSGNDLLATADTGSGKTLAFILPALERILIPTAPEVKGRGPRVLVLAPTRELANQIAETTRKMGQFMQFKFGTITGGVPYPYQERLLRNGCDLLIATPGRLIDHMNRGLVDFSRIEMFILDEADRMLDMGFRKDIDIILESMPKQRQTLLFSATFDGPIQNIAKQFLTDPECVKLANGTKPHALITQCIHQSDDFKHKRALLVHVLEDPSMWQAIVFTKTKRGAEELANNLSMSDIKCAALHGDMKQSKRTRTLARVHRGEIKVLIATDVAARGLDVKNLSHVINFDVPNTVDDYVHRIGRTGRSGAAGTAISLVGPSDWSTISDIERVMGQRIERRIIEGLEPKNDEPKRGQVISMQHNRKKMSSGGKSSGFRPRSERRTEQRPGQRSERRSEQRSGQRSERRTEQRSDRRSEQRPEQRSGQRSERRSEHRSERRSNFRSDSNFNSDSNFRSDLNFRSDRKSDSRSGSRFHSDSKSNYRSEPRSGQRSEQRSHKSDQRSHHKLDQRSEQRRERNSEQRSERESKHRSNQRSDFGTNARAGHRSERQAKNSDFNTSNRFDFKAKNRSEQRTNGANGANGKSKGKSDMRSRSSDARTTKPAHASRKKSDSFSLLKDKSNTKPKLRRKLVLPA